VQACAVVQFGKRGELVGRKPRNRGIDRRHRGDARRDFGEHRITDGISQMLVDAAKSMQIDDHDTDGGAGRVA